ncbi:MAG: hypothetical protein ACI9H8_000303 [Lysobacterales bacterium]|jgi:uncharacterized protein YceH (UPF0502 family)
MRQNGADYTRNAELLFRFLFLRYPEPMNELSPIQVRVLGCLMEKKETTPEQYPLTLNALKNACNQKSSRYPVTDYSEGEVGHTLRELESLDLVKEEWGTRVSKYGHLAGKQLGLHRKGLAIMAVLMLRGPQTLNELRIHSHRMFEFDDLDDVQYVLDQLQKDELKLVTAIPRQPGQKEGRYAHLLCGEPDISDLPVRVARPAGISSEQQAGLEARIGELESELEEVKARLASLEASNE